MENKKFKVGDIVFVSNNDYTYEEEHGVREHKNFFGKVTEVHEYAEETYVYVEFETDTEWVYSDWELSHANELKDFTLAEIEIRYGVIINATYI